MRILQLKMNSNWRVVMTALALRGLSNWTGKKDGQQAVQLAQQTVYDLMILDIMMPGA